MELETLLAEWPVPPRETFMLGESKGGVLFLSSVLEKGR